MTAERSLLCECPAQSEILARDDATRDVFVLVAGLARVLVFSSAGRVVGFRRMKPGDIFGEYAAIDSQPRSACIEALRPSTVVRMPATLFAQLVDTEPAFRNAIMQHLVAMLRGLTKRVVEFSTLDVPHRIQAELLRMAAERNGLLQIDPAPTHLELAIAISTHREAVSRELSRLTKAGIIARVEKRLVIREPETLRKLLDGQGDG